MDEKNFFSGKNIELEIVSMIEFSVPSLIIVMFGAFILVMPNAHFIVCCLMLIIGLAYLQNLAISNVANIRGG